AQGHGGSAGLGELVLVDPGGATTDVHSVADGRPSREGVIAQGLPEPRVKRTVEGDLGMRHNAAAIADAAGLDALAADSGLPAARIAASIAALATDVARIPASPDELALDRALARAAIRLAVKRHAGTVETVFTVTGPVAVQHGKDLGDVAVLIGTGGAIAHAAQPATILQAALADPTDPLSLRPRAPRLMLDRSYIVYACGLLAQVEPQAALELGLKHLVELAAQEEVRDGAVRA
ncbi:MAG TPA: glutamate mutase L, partial [Burkholderiaceae bacterium]|nr:glutamate mutase L [Burkholderiaceae bacterium]